MARRFAVRLIVRAEVGKILRKAAFALGIFQEIPFLLLDSLFLHSTLRGLYVSSCLPVGFASRFAGRFSDSAGVHGPPAIFLSPGERCDDERKRVEQRRTGDNPERTPSASEGGVEGFLWRRRGGWRRAGRVIASCSFTRSTTLPPSPSGFGETSRVNELRSFTSPAVKRTMKIDLRVQCVTSRMRGVTNSHPCSARVRDPATREQHALNPLWFRVRKTLLIASHGCLDSVLRRRT